MNETHVLNGEQLEEAVRSLNVSWAVLPGRGLVRVVPTQDFSSGYKVVSQVAHMAEEANFEPELTLRHNEVEISLPTYTSGGVTELDVLAAAKIDSLLG